jgi:hypothetical protein
MDQIARPSGALALWKRTGALRTLVPALADIDDRTLAALDWLAQPGPALRPYRRLARIALLFVELGEKEVRRALTALRFSKREINRVAAFAVSWSQAGLTMERVLASGASPSDSDVRRWIAAVGRLDVAPFMRIAAALWEARRLAGGKGPSATAVRALYKRMLAAAMRDPIQLADLAVDGSDLVAIGMPAGPIVGKILHALLESVLEDPSRNTRDWLLQEAKRLYDQLRGDPSRGSD